MLTGTRSFPISGGIFFGVRRTINVQSNLFQRRQS